MKISRWLYKIDKYYKHQFDVPVQEQLSYLNILPEPHNDIDRSYNQFCCQQYFVPGIFKVIWNIIAIFCIPLILVVFFLKGCLTHIKEHFETIAEDKGMPEIIPLCLRERYNINTLPFNSNFELQASDFKIIFRLIRSYPYPFFVLKCITRIASYSSLITKYTPKQIICHGEYSFCSSLLTYYCNRRNVKHINVMHGEKLLYIRDSFFRFDECYVWDQHYVDLFIQLKAEKTQFKIDIPPSLIITKDEGVIETDITDYKYYLANYTEEEIFCIVKAMSLIKEHNKTVKYRIHPRESDLELLKKYVSDEEIEYPSDVNIVNSIQTSRNIVGSYTTVLLQAYLSGYCVVLDDVTYKERYNQLKEYRYILSNKEVSKLSELIN